MFTSVCNVGGCNTSLKIENKKFKKEKKIIIEILEIIGLSKKALTDEPSYNKEVETDGFGFKTLFGILIDRGENSDEIYSIYEGKGYYAPIDRLLTVKQFLLEVQNGNEEVKNKVDEIIK